MDYVQCGHSIFARAFVFAQWDWLVLIRLLSGDYYNHDFLKLVFGILFADLISTQNFFLYQNSAERCVSRLCLKMK
jgi:hypothetical protein